MKGCFWQISSGIFGDVKGYFRRCQGVLLDMPGGICIPTNKPHQPCKERGLSLVTDRNKHQNMLAHVQPKTCHFNLSFLRGVTVLQMPIDFSHIF